MTAMVSTPENARHLLGLVQVVTSSGEVLDTFACVDDALCISIAKLDHGDAIVRDGRVLATFHVFADRDPVWRVWWLSPTERAT